MPPSPVLLSVEAVRDVARFPEPRDADEYGLVAFGGNFDPDVLLAAYTQGIFPWPSEEFPYAWFSPDPRMVLPIDRFHISKSLKKSLRKQTFSVTFDTAFEQVVAACSQIPRGEQDGTWITTELMTGFIELHQQGFAHSVEAWRDGRLVGGVYGLALGGVFCGESMFFLEPDASKVAFVHLVQKLDAWGFHFVDCQVQTDHLTRFGAHEVTRNGFLDRLDVALKEPTLRGAWTESPTLLAPGSSLAQD